MKQKKVVEALSAPDARGAVGNAAQLRKATVEDIALIQELSRRIWPHTYSSILTDDQIEYMLEMMYSHQSLKEQMAGGHEFSIVYLKGEAIGFVSFSEEGDNFYKLQKIYVMPSLQGKGTGSFIMRELFSELRSRGAAGVKLNVNRNNKARQFYEKLGFSVIAEEDIAIGNGFFMNDFIMMKEF